MDDLKRRKEAAALADQIMAAPTKRKVTRKGKETEAKPTAAVSTRARGNPNVTKGKGRGQGEGWGGPAKGVGRPDPIASPGKLIPGCSASKRLIASARREDRSANALALEQELLDIALNIAGNVSTETRVTAAVRLHAIYEGQPIARNLNANVDDFDRIPTADLVARYVEVVAGEDKPRPRLAAPRLPGGPADVVH